MFGLIKERVLIATEIIVRSKTFLIIFFSLMIFSATITAIILISDYVGKEAEYIANKIVFPQPPLMISVITERESAGILQDEAVVGCLKNAKIDSHNNSIYINVIILDKDNVMKFSKFEGVLLKIVSINNYTRGIIIPTELSESLSLKLNDVVYLIIDNSRLDSRIIGLYHIESIKSMMPIVVFTEPENYLCQYKVVITHNGVDVRHYVLYNIISNIDAQIEKLTLNWLILFGIVYLVLSFLLLRKFIDESINVLKILLVQGLNPGSYISMAFLIITLIINFAGMGLGLITVHGVIWAIRFLGLFFPVRPSLTYDAVAIMLTYSVIMSLMGWSVVRYSLKGDE